MDCVPPSRNSGRARKACSTSEMPRGPCGGQHVDRALPSTPQPQLALWIANDAEQIALRMPEADAPPASRSSGSTVPHRIPAPPWRASRNRSAERASHRPSGRQISTRSVVFCSIGAHFRRATASASDADGDIFRQRASQRKARGDRICADSPIAGPVPSRAPCSALRQSATSLDSPHRITPCSLRCCRTSLPMESAYPDILLPPEPEQYL